MATLRLAKPFQAIDSRASCRPRRERHCVVVVAAVQEAGDSTGAAAAPLSRRQLQAAVLASVLAAQAVPAHALG